MMDNITVVAKIGSDFESLWQILAAPAFGASVCLLLLLVYFYRKTHER